MWRVFLFALIVLLLAILLLRIRLVLVYEDSICLRARLGLIKFDLYPKKKGIDLKKFSPKGIRKQLNRTNRKLDSQRKKEQNATSAKKNKGPSEVIDTVKLACDILLAVRKRFFRYLRIDVAKLYIVIATDDAAKTAITYGVAVQSVQYLISILDSITNFRFENNTSIYVGCDYCLPSSVIEVDMCLSLRVWQVLAVLLKAAAALVLRGNKKSNNQHN